ncbi:MAG: winged helix-turn-helix domain-containing protein [Ferrimicrobium sp.]
MATLLAFSQEHASRIADLFHKTQVDLVTVTTLDELANTRIAWLIAAIDATHDLESAIAACRQLRRSSGAVSPILLLVDRHQVRELILREALFDDFAVTPFDPVELGVRVASLLARTGNEDSHSVVTYGPLSLDINTYQAFLEGHPIDLTYMEYELLKFLASHPGTVFSRETLLSRVWGYEYYGGARTVDVHIRRLRSKLGERHDALIQTVRSVGYRLGQSSHMGGDRSTRTH